LCITQLGITLAERPQNVSALGANGLVERNLWRSLVGDRSLRMAVAKTRKVTQQSNRRTPGRRVELVARSGLLGRDALPLLQHGPLRERRRVSAALPLFVPSGS
jgi:hypothetical protein